jgi:hypothetical protein
MIELIATSLILAALTMFPAQPTYIIDGQVQDNRGKAVGCVRVCAYAADFAPNKPNVAIPCAFTDERGRFTIAVNKPSNYKLFYDHSEQGYWPPYLAFFRSPSATLTEAFLDDANARASVAIYMLPKNGLIVGKSVDTKTGLPVESMEFILCHANNQEVCWQTTAKSADGNFTIPAPHVPFILKIKANGFDEWLGPNGENEKMSMSVAPESKTELTVYLKRSDASAEKAISETEKQVGVHLPAPVQLSPAEGAVFTHYPRLTRLEWSPVEGAASYTVEVDSCAGGLSDRRGCVNPQPLRIKNNPPTSGLISNSYEFSFGGMQPGRWRVWAVDKEGREGFKSPWRHFVYRQ